VGRRMVHSTGGSGGSAGRDVVTTIFRSDYYHEKIFTLTF